MQRQPKNEISIGGSAAWVGRDLWYMPIQTWVQKVGTEFRIRYGRQVNKRLTLALSGSLMSWDNADAGSNAPWQRKFYMSDAFFYMKVLRKQRWYIGGGLSYRHAATTTRVCSRSNNSETCKETNYATNDLGMLLFMAYKIPIYRNLAFDIEGRIRSYNYFDPLMTGGVGLSYSF
jgi:hypothetical protein